MCTQELKRLRHNSKFPKSGILENGNDQTSPEYVDGNQRPRPLGQAAPAPVPIPVKEENTSENVPPPRPITNSTGNKGSDLPSPMSGSSRLPKRPADPLRDGGTAFSRNIIEKPGLGPVRHMQGGAQPASNRTTLQNPAPLNTRHEPRVGPASFTDENAKRIQNESLTRLPSTMH